MSILVSTLKEELASVLRLEKRHHTTLLTLPQGSFIVRNVKGRLYGYLTFREGNKMRQKYLGRLDEAQIKSYRSKTEQRKELKKKLKSLGEQKKILRKALRGKTRSTRR